jgi:hypothetical protein
MSYSRRVGTSCQISVDCFANVCASALAGSRASAGESTRTGFAAVARLDGVGVPSGAGGVEDIQASKSMLSSARALSPGCRGSPQTTVKVFVEGRAVSGDGGLRITGAGYWWKLGGGMAKFVHSRLSRCWDAAASSTAA